MSGYPHPTTTRRIAIADLNMSIVQPCRENLRMDVISRYVEILQDAEPNAWPFDSTVTVANIKGDPENVYYVVDGQHRIKAASICGLETVVASFFCVADLDEAVRMARCANCRHGERLTANEMRENIAAYLRAGGLRKTDTTVAKAFGVSRATVASIRNEVGMPSRRQAAETAVRSVLEANPAASSREIAEATGLPRSTVSRLSHSAQFEHNGTPAMPPRPAPKTDATPAPVTANAETEAETPAPVPPMPPRRPSATVNTDNKLSISPAIDNRPEGPAPILDDIGQEVPPDLWIAWEEEQQRVAGWLKQARALRRDVKQAAEAGALRSLKFGLFTQTLLARLDQTVAALADIRPEAMCSCQGIGCDRCNGRGWMTKDQYKRNIPDEEKAVQL